MRLTNINCPQCNGRLSQQEDKFYCNSCGSAFNVDYDEADVEYARLVTEPERARLLLDKERKLLAKDVELRRRFITGEMKKEFIEQAKTTGMSYLGGIIYAVVLGGISTLFVIIFVIALFISAGKNYRGESEMREEERLERLEDLSVRDIEKDENFLENAVAAGIAYERFRRDDTVENDAEDGGDAYISGSPVAESCYLLKAGSDNILCIIYKTTYEFSGNKDTREVYDSVFFENIEPDETGHIVCDYSYCSNANGSGADYHWDGYDSAEAAYEALLEDDFEIFEVDI